MKTVKLTSFNQPSNLQCKDLHDYLKSRTPQMLDTLYGHPTICLAVYRQVFFIFLLIDIFSQLYNLFLTIYSDLPELGRHYVIRLLFVEQPVPQAVVASWGTQQYSKYFILLAEYKNCLNILIYNAYLLGNIMKFAPV